MEYSITIYFALFIIYAVAGWIMEVITKLIFERKLGDRGFLIGPYCPIYGCGAILITLLLTRFYSQPVLLFVMAILVCGILEYFTSYIMEKIFNARWWDYSNSKFNINGRVCLETIIPFGILGLVIIYVTNPILLNFLQNLNQDFLNIIVTVIGAVFILDVIVSFKIISKVRVAARNISKENVKDNTEEITAKVKEVLRSGSFLSRRLINAFPDLKTRLKEKKDEIMEKTQEVTKEIKNGINQKKEDVKKGFEKGIKKVKNKNNKNT